MKLLPRGQLPTLQLYLTVNSLQTCSLASAFCTIYSVSGRTSLYCSSREFLVHPPSGLSSVISSSGQSYLTSLNRVKNFILPEWLFHLVYLCNNLLQNLVVKITVYYIPGFRAICTRHSRVACPCLSWKAWWWGWDHPMTCSLTWLAVDGKGQTSVGWNSGASLASFSISLLFPHIATSRCLDFLQGGSGLQRCTERERESQEEAVLFIWSSSLGSHIASLLPYCVLQSSHEPT